MKKKLSKARADIYQMVTDKVIAALEQGDRPWWSDSMLNCIGRPSVPYNAVSGRTYRGHNHLALMVAAAEMSGERFDPRFCTFNQAKEKGWHVKKGAKGMPVVLYRPYTFIKSQYSQEDGKKPANNERILDRLAKLKAGQPVAPLRPEGAVKDAGNADATGEKKTIWILRTFTVFHASQIEGIPALSTVAPTWQPNESVNSMLEGMQLNGMDFQSGAGEACYSLSEDKVFMPDVSNFDTMLDYAHVLAHELGHGTGHVSRLNRKDLYSDDPAAYAREELVAELTSAMVCSQLGLTYDVTRHARYIGDWIQELKNDKKLLLRASGLAAAASDYLIGLVPELRAQISAQRTQESGAEVSIEESLDLSQIGAANDADVADAIDWLSEIPMDGFEALIADVAATPMPLAACM